MKLAIISLGGESSQMILNEAKPFFEKIDHIDIREVEVNASSDKLGVLYKNKPLEKYDCVYVRGSYKYALLQRSLTRALHQDSYTPLSPEAFTIAHNKFLTLLELQKNKVSLPKTYLAATTEGAKRVLENIHYPVILKIPSGTHGKGVMFADSISSANSMLDTLEVFRQPYIIQEYIETGATDLRTIVVGNKVVAAMRRKATNKELRANIHMGGKGESCDVDYDTEQISVKAAKAVGAEICAVDILEGSKPMVIEVNLSPGLKGITEATKKNVALLVAKFLAQKTKEALEKKKADGVGEIVKELDSKDKKTKELLINLNIKAGVIKLPKMVTDITKFDSDDEVILKISKGKLEVERYNIKR